MPELAAFILLSFVPQTAFAIVLAILGRSHKLPIETVLGWTQAVVTIIELVLGYWQLRACMAQQMAEQYRQTNETNPSNSANDAIEQQTIALQRERQEAGIRETEMVRG